MRTRAHAAKPQKKKKNIFLRVACALFGVYIVVQVVSLRIQIQAKAAQEEELQAQIVQQESLNESLKEKLENYEVYLEEEARDNGYVKNGEQIYKVVPEE